MIFIGEDRATVTLDEQIERGEREQAHLDFVLADDYRDWGLILGSAKGEPLSHQPLLRWLMAHEHNLADPSVLQAMQSVSITATLDYQSEITDNGDTVSAIFKTTRGEDAKTFPKQFEISLAVLEQDILKADWADATISLELITPATPKDDSKPSFRLSCPTWKHLQIERIARERQSITADLDGWAVFHGVHKTEPRMIGAE